MSEKEKLSIGRLIKRALMTIGVIILGGALYVLFVPISINPALKAPRPVIEPVADADNAWIEYNKAAEELGDYQKMSQEAPFNLEKVIRGEEELKPEHLTYLEKHQSIIDHVIAGAKRPKAQFYKEAPSFDSKSPYLLQMRAMANLATLQARQLEQQGKFREAMELDLVAYKMATDVVEPNAMLISGLVAVVCRSISSSALYHLLKEGKTDAATDIEIARRVAELDSRMPNAFQMMQWEWEMAERAAESSLLEGKGTIEGRNLAAFPLALRQRAYLGFMTQHASVLSRSRGFLEKWDFKGMQTEVNSWNDEAAGWYKHFSIGEMIGSILLWTAIPSPTASMKSLYFDRASGAALQAFAAISAYQKAHGKFPETLEQATTEAGIKVPLDPATAKPIGYRLEDGRPLVWLAGVDGQDDGGKQAYLAANRDKMTPGSDLIFKFGELPFWFK